MTDISKKLNMLCDGDRVLCALSGGADSVYMTHRLTHWAKKHDIAVAAAHFTHGIRPEAAEAELLLCEELCKKLDIPFYHGEGNVPEYAKAQSQSTEAAARHLRYEFLRNTARTANANKIATAHNLNDQAETVLLNMVRGGGLSKGIPPVRDNIIRPILSVSRAEIERYLVENGLAYAVDATNADNEYSRNRVRNIVLPELLKINSAAVENIAGSGFVANEANAYINRQSGDIFITATALDINKMMSADRAVAAAAILQAYDNAELVGQLSRRNIEDIMRMHAMLPSACVCIPGGECRRSYNKLEFMASEDAFIPEDAELNIGEIHKWGEYTVTLAEGAGKSGWIFDRDKLKFPIYIRSKRPGDVIFTAKHHRKIKKYLIDMKMPKKSRDILPILWDNEKVLCIADLCCNEELLSKNKDKAVTINCEKG